jgi:hypothetical protein
MSDFNSQHNRVVWCDIYVSDLDRAVAFYRAVLDIEVSLETFDGFRFAILQHDAGNGGCLVPDPEQICTHGPLLYFNVDGRIRDAVTKVQEHHGQVLQDVHAIGPHGWRAIVRDSEGNRIALHATSDT